MTTAINRRFFVRLSVLIGLFVFECSVLGQSSSDTQSPIRVPHPFLGRWWFDGDSQKAIGRYELSGNGKDHAYLTMPDASQQLTVASEQLAEPDVMFINSVHHYAEARRMLEKMTLVLPVDELDALESPIQFHQGLTKQLRGAITTSFPRPYREKIELYPDMLQIGRVLYNGVEINGRDYRIHRYEISEKNDGLKSIKLIRDNSDAPASIYEPSKDDELWLVIGWQYIYSYRYVNQSLELVNEDTSGRISGRNPMIHPLLEAGVPFVPVHSNHKLVFDRIRNVWTDAYSAKAHKELVLSEQARRLSTIYEHPLQARRLLEESDELGAGSEWREAFASLSQGIGEISSSRSHRAELTPRLKILNDSLNNDLFNIRKGFLIWRNTDAASERSMQEIRVSLESVEKSDTASNAMKSLASLLKAWALVHRAKYEYDEKAAQICAEAIDIEKRLSGQATLTAETPYFPNYIARDIDELASSFGTSTPIYTKALSVLLPKAKDVFFNAIRGYKTTVGEQKIATKDAVNAFISLMDKAVRIALNDSTIRFPARDCQARIAAILAHSIEDDVDAVSQFDRGLQYVKSSPSLESLIDDPSIDSEIRAVLAGLKRFQQPPLPTTAEEIAQSAAKNFHERSIKSLENANLHLATLSTSFETMKSSAVESKKSTWSKKSESDFSSLISSLRGVELNAGTDGQLGADLSEIDRRRAHVNQFVGLYRSSKPEQEAEMAASFSFQLETEKARLSKLGTALRADAMEVRSTVHDGFADFWENDLNYVPMLENASEAIVTEHQAKGLRTELDENKSK